MLHVDNFLKYFIGTMLTILLFMNVVYAFNLTNTLGVPIVFANDNANYSRYFFGVNDLINSFTTYFEQNDMLGTGRELMGHIYSSMNALSINNLINYQQNWGSNSGVDIFGVLIGLFNIFINVPYTIMLVIYFLSFFIYVLLIVFSIISYSFYLINGAFRTEATRYYAYVVTIRNLLMV